jgi:hypothetical protein
LRKINLTDFLRDNDKRLSSSRLGFLVGICIASILVVFLALTASLTDGIFIGYCILVSGGYAVGKLGDSFGMEAASDVDDDK